MALCGCSATMPPICQAAVDSGTGPRFCLATRTFQDCTRAIWHCQRPRRRGVCHCSDPKSPHFDLTLIRLTGFTSRHQFQRRLTAVALFINPALGLTDLAKAETLLPVSRFHDDSERSLTVNARTLWSKLPGNMRKAAMPGCGRKRVQS